MRARHQIHLQRCNLPRGITAYTRPNTEIDVLSPTTISECRLPLGIRGLVDGTETTELDSVIDHLGILSVR